MPPWPRRHAGSTSTLDTVATPPDPMCADPVLVGHVRPPRWTVAARRARRARRPGTPVVLALLAGLVLTPVSAGCSTDAASSSRSTRRSPTHAERPGEPSTSLDANATVVRVVDGDTIVAEVAGTDERVRLIGIDTPESVKPRSPVECFGKEASAHTRRLLADGTGIRLVLDVEERDRYGRLLAYVYRAADGMFVNLALAADGDAGLLTYPPNVAHVDELRAAVAAAREHGRGLWSACADDLPVRS